MRFAGIVLSLLIGTIAVGSSGSMGLKDRPPWVGVGDPVKGREIYINNCMRCHGTDGKGSPGVSLVPPPADLGSDAVQSRFTSTLFRSIHGGKPNTAMGAWKHALSDDDIWDVLDYVRTLRDGKASQP
jgi:mono/diheme cytochrome c family protein